MFKKHYIRSFLIYDLIKIWENILFIYIEEGNVKEGQFEIKKTLHEKEKYDSLIETVMAFKNNR